MFRIDAQNVYSRGPYCLVFIGLCSLGMLFSGVLSLCTLARARNAEERREHYYISLFILPPFVGAVLQTFFYGVTLIWPCTALSLLLVFINIQNKQISTDALTGINNRRNFNRYLSAQLAMPGPPRGLTLVLIDIDGFKTINDTYGHLSGDAALVNAADILKQYCTGRRDFLARYGGDEFAIIRRTDPDWTPDKTIADLERLTERYNRQGATPFKLSFSVGCAVLGNNGLYTADELINAADRNMYIAKSDKAMRQQPRAAVEQSQARG